MFAAGSTRKSATYTILDPALSVLCTNTKVQIVMFEHKIRGVPGNSSSINQISLNNIGKYSSYHVGSNIYNILTVTYNRSR